MASKVSICSNALVGLGDDPITALTDPTNRARHANRLWDDTRRAVLRAHPWNCATKRVSLARLTAAPAWEFSYQYQLPSDYLRMVKTNLPKSWVYKIEGSSLLADVDSINIKYIYDLEDVAQWDALLVDTMVARMKFELAYTIAGRQSLAKGAWDEFQAKLREARTVDGQDEDPEKISDTTLVDIRF